MIYITKKHKKVWYNINMKNKKKEEKMKFKNLSLAVGLFFVVSLLAGCSGSKTISSVGEDIYSSIAYKVWGTSSSKLKASGTSEGEMLVLPVGEVPPSNFTEKVAGAKVTFADGTTVIADSEGVFDISKDANLLSKDVIKNAASSTDAQPEIIVTAPGKKPLSTIVPVTEESKDEKDIPISLRIVPHEGKLFVGEIVILNALRVNASGKIIKATNVVWTKNPDGSDTGTFDILKTSDKGEFVVCKATGVGNISIKASILTQSNNEISDTAKGEVVDNDINKIVEIKGTLTSDFDGDGVWTPQQGAFVSLDLPGVNGLKEFHFVGKSDDNGNYSVLVPLPPTDTRFFIMVGIPDKGKYKGVPSTITILANQPDEDANTIGIQVLKDIKVGASFILPPPPPPIDRIIREAWAQVEESHKPHAYEPFSGVRELFTLTGVGQPYAETTGTVKFGFYSNWTYNRTITNTGQTQVSLTKNWGKEIEQMVIVKLSNSGVDNYQFVSTVSIPERNLNIKKKEGTITDTFSTGNLYIASIDVVVKHYLFDVQDKPFRTNKITWTRKDTVTLVLTMCPLSTQLVDSVYTGDGEVGSYYLSKLDVTRGIVSTKNITTPDGTRTIPDFDPTSTSVAFNINGSYERAIKPVTSGTPEMVTSTITGTVFSGYDATDTSRKGYFNFDGEKEDIHFDLLLPPTIAIWPFDIASGKLTIKVSDPSGNLSDKVFNFVIRSNGTIIVRFPDGSINKFPV